MSNTGGATAPNVRVAFFMSDNESLNAVTDSLVGTVPNRTFSPGESRWVTLPSANIPTTSTHRPDAGGAAVLLLRRRDRGRPDRAEPRQQLREVAGPRWPARPRPNLLPVEMQTPARAGAGELVAVSRTLTNLGNRDSPRRATATTCRPTPSSPPTISR